MFPACYEWRIYLRLAIRPVLTASAPCGDASNIGTTLDCQAFPNWAARGHSFRLHLERSVEPAQFLIPRFLDYSSGRGVFRQSVTCLAGDCGYVRSALLAVIRNYNVGERRGRGRIREQRLPQRDVVDALDAKEMNICLILQNGVKVSCRGICLTSQC